MKRTTVYLPEELKRALEQRAKLEGRTEAEVIRDALSAMLQPRSRPSKLSFGKFASGHTDTSARVDKVLRDTGFGAG